MPHADDRVTVAAGTPMPHALTVSAVADGMHVDPRRGLALEEIAARRALRPERARSGPSRDGPCAIRRAVMEPFVLLLFVAGVLAIVLGEVRDGILGARGLVPIVGADVLISYRSERALASLRDATAPRALVRRRGVRPMSSPRTSSRATSCCYGRAISCPRMPGSAARTHSRVDRSVLTGESVPELATVEPDDVGAVVADRRSILYAGTAVVGGRGEGIVVATGAGTELGRIARGLSHTERRRSLCNASWTASCGSSLSWRAASSWSRSDSASCRAIRPVPIYWPGSPRRSPRSRRSPGAPGGHPGWARIGCCGAASSCADWSAEETLGAIDLIITDKTGTLTENRLALSDVLTPAGPSEGEARRATLALALRAEDDAGNSRPARHRARSRARCSRRRANLPSS